MKKTANGMKKERVKRKKRRKQDGMGEKEGIIVL